MRAAEVSLGQGDEEFSTKCRVLKEKLDLLLASLHDEECATTAKVRVRLIVFNL